MNKWRTSWTVYSIGLFVAWTIVLTAVWLLKGGGELRDVLLVFAGFFIGWLSATIKHWIIRRS